MISQRQDQIELQSYGQRLSLPMGLINLDKVSRAIKITSFAFLLTFYHRKRPVKNESKQEKKISTEILLDDAKLSQLR